MDVPSVNRQLNSDLEDLASKVPKESGPKPQEVGQVIHGDQQAAPPSHLVWPDHGQFQSLAKLGVQKGGKNI